MVVMFIGAVVMGRKPKPGKCLILEEKYCREVVLKDHPNGSGLVALYKVPKGAPVFAPEAGFVSDSPSFFFRSGNGEGYETYSGISLRVGRDERVENLERSYGLVFDNSQRMAIKEVKRGAKIGVMGGGKIGVFGDYNLVLTISRPDLTKKAGTLVSDSDYVKWLANPRR